MSGEAEGHLALSKARETEAMHLATVVDQIKEYDLSISQRRSRIQAHRDAIQAEQDGIRDDSRARAKLARKRRIFRYAVFQLEQVDQE